MTVSKSTKEFAATVYKRAFGVDPMDIQKEVQKQFEQRLEQEQKRAEQEQKRAEQEIAAINNVIRNLSQTLELSVEDIAKLVGKDVDYIQAILQAK